MKLRHVVTNAVRAPETTILPELGKKKVRAYQLRRESLGGYLRSTSSVAEFTVATWRIGLGAEC